MRILFFLFTITIYTGFSFAGGPINIQGATGNTPVFYQNPNITLHAENGTLGFTSNANAVFQLQEAIKLWNNVSTSTINLTVNQTLLNFDVDIDNFDDYLPSVDNTNLNASDGLNPVVFDNNGDIIDAFFGVGQSDDILGFATSIFFINGNNYLEGYAVINGKNLGLTSAELKLLFAHEIGHLIGIDHSQNDISNLESNTNAPIFCTTASTSNYPLMYPVACRNTDSLHADDISAISALYPAANINANLGVLKGRFLNESGQAVLGANIWAKNTTSGIVISGVSDFLKQNTGFFRLYLPAGSYTLHANSINTEFTAASSIGPYSDNIADASFIAPHPILATTYLGSTAPNAEVVSIANGQTQTINFSTIGADITILANNNSDGDSKLFGTISPFTLLFAVISLLWIRRIERYTPA